MSTEQERWYAEKAANDTQGLVADEITGRTVAVVYDRKDMELIAAAPDLLEACEELTQVLETIPLTADQPERDRAARAVVRGQEAIAKAKQKT